MFCFGNSNPNLLKEERNVNFFAKDRNNIKKYFDENLKTIANLKKGERLELDGSGFLKPASKWTWYFGSKKDNTLQSIEKIVEFWNDYCAAVPMNHEDAEAAEKLAVQASWAIGSRKSCQKVDGLIKKLTQSTFNIRENNQAKFIEKGKISPEYRRNSFDNLKQYSAEIQENALAASFLGENFDAFVNGSQDEDPIMGQFSDLKDKLEDYDLGDFAEKLFVDFHYASENPEFLPKLNQLIEDFGTPIDDFCPSEEFKTSVINKIENSDLFPHCADAIHLGRLSVAAKKKHEAEQAQRQIDFAKNLGVTVVGTAAMAGATGLGGPLGAIVAFYAKDAVLGGANNALQTALEDEPKAVKLKLVRDFERLIYLWKTNPAEILNDACEQASAIQKQGNLALKAAENILIVTRAAVNI